MKKIDSFYNSFFVKAFSNMLIILADENNDGDTITVFYSVVWCKMSKKKVTMWNFILTYPIPIHD